MTLDAPERRRADLRCPQCGAPVRPIEDDPFLACSFCGTHAWLDAGRAVRHFVVEPRLDAAAATAALARWLKEREVVGAIAPIACEAVFFPLWQIETRRGPRVVPAAGTLYDGLESFRLPQGDLKVFSPDRLRGPSGEATRCDEATVPLQAAAVRAEEAPPRNAGVPAAPAAGSEIEARLIHVPLHLVAYRHGGLEYAAAVDATSGRVYPVTAPRSSGARIDRAFAALMTAGLLADVIAVLLLRDLPLLGASLVVLIGVALYAAGLSLHAWAET